MFAYYYKVWLWENGQRTTDLSEFVQFPIFAEDKLDETLNAGKIELKKVPTTSGILRNKPLAPKTKIVLDRHSSPTFDDTPISYEFVVDHDDVEIYPTLGGICTHRLHLIEPSAVAQGMHCDNFALTYELQDVTMNYRTTQSTTRPVDVDISPPRGHDTAIARREAWTWINAPWLQFM